MMQIAPWGKQFNLGKLSGKKGKISSKRVKIPIKSPTPSLKRKCRSWFMCVMEPCAL